MLPLGKITIIAIAALSVGGCANMTTTEQRTLSGAAIGALGGAAIAAIAESSVAAGAGIGAGVGAVAGYLYSHSGNQQQASSHPAKNHYHAARAAKPSKPDNPTRASDVRLAAS